MTNKLKEDFLEEGDVFYIKKGMQIHAEIPEMFIYQNLRDSKKLASTVITVGEVRDNTKGKKLDTKKFEGLYLVERTEDTGGGTGNGMGDYYPDGHKVSAIKLSKTGEYSPDKTKISFYQSGCFSGMILPNDVEVVAQFEKTWVFKGTVKPNKKNKM